MTDRPDMDAINRLESELMKMTPARVPVEMVGQIGEALRRDSVARADRLLIGAMSIGLLSACAIVVLVLYGEGMSAPTSFPLLHTGNQVLAGTEFAWVAEGR
jgi:hypothetical protein